MFSVFSQLSWIPDDLNSDALELFNKTNVQQFLSENPNLKEYTFLKNSDAHFINQVGEFFSVFNLNELSFDEIRKAIRKQEGRFVQIS